MMSNSFYLNECDECRLLNEAHKLLSVFKGHMFHNAPYVNFPWIIMIIFFVR